MDKSRVYLMSLKIWNVVNIINYLIFKLSCKLFINLVALSMKNVR